jgi:hypothetical protein
MRTFVCKIPSKAAGKIQGSLQITSRTALNAAVELYFYIALMRCQRVSAARMVPGLRCSRSNRLAYTVPLRTCRTCLPLLAPIAESSLCRWILRLLSSAGRRHNEGRSPNLGHCGLRFMSMPRCLPLRLKG